MLISPILIALTLAVLITSGRPIFFRQQRIGLNGEEFDMLKFRTMKGSPESSGHNHGHWVFESLDSSQSLLGGAKPNGNGNGNGNGHVANGNGNGNGNGHVANGNGNGNGQGTAWHRHRERPPSRCGLRRGPPHADRPVPAPLLARRAAAAHQRPARRHVPGRAPARAARVRRLFQEACTATGPPPRQVGHHRLGPGSRPARQDIALPTGSNGTTTTSRTGPYGST